jgi:hypothetical protein
MGEMGSSREVKKVVDITVLSTVFEVPKRYKVS